MARRARELRTDIYAPWQPVEMIPRAPRKYMAGPPTTLFVLENR
jgi:hypothetical protein